LNLRKLRIFRFYVNDFFENKYKEKKFLTKYCSDHRRYEYLKKLPKRNLENKKILKKAKEMI